MKNDAKSGKNRKNYPLDPTNKDEKDLKKYSRRSKYYDEFIDNSPNKFPPGKVKRTAKEAYEDEEAKVPNEMNEGGFDPDMESHLDDENHEADPSRKNLYGKENTERKIHLGNKLRY
ncbi:hypothetical protein COR50_02110 [Chitinophaga caeni]|uniref:Uncharacterized protein n=1 Tax=Chitinophaga caeni TaxID=2029983 RepID=A0A291QQ41_9BACT|nr:hypothetical protein [Chitinophaga caeni]ATL46051.1 hypothetical protein COR50_02110 [Chitinophaga caeni]